jgi:hypothetical protein
MVCRKLLYTKGVIVQKFMRYSVVKWTANSPEPIDWILANWNLQSNH